MLPIPCPSSTVFLHFLLEVAFTMLNQLRLCQDSISQFKLFNLVSQTFIIRIITLTSIPLKILHQHSDIRLDLLSPGFFFLILGVAFHPLDGILQALPHTIALFIIPTHFTAHLVLIFLEGIWTANIHDSIHGNVWPIMGAGYHTVHHTTYRHNYGHFTIWMDWMFGTLRDPLQDEGKAM